jgi:hypothetical protein
MNSLVENDLQIALPPNAAGRKFDDGVAHGLSHCMKAVDFIVELKDRTLFVEIKDPDQPGAPGERREAFIQKFLGGHIDESLKTKYRDSWLYEWAQGRADKPVTYLVLMGASTLSDAELLARTDALKRLLPVSGPNGQPWGKPFVAGCAVLNLAAWNKALPQFAASRLGVSAATA